MIPEAARKTIKEWKADQRVDDLRGDGVQAGRLEKRMVVSDAGTTRAAGAIGFVTEVTNVTPASAGGSGPATLATPAPLWPRERPNSRQNGHEGPLAWPRRRCRGQGDGGVAKETLAWPKRHWHGQRDHAPRQPNRPRRLLSGPTDPQDPRLPSSTNNPVPNVTSWTGRIVAMRGAPPVARTRDGCARAGAARLPAELHATLAGPRNLT